MIAKNYQLNLGRLPSWAYVAAMLLGVLVAVGALSYRPEGRINLVWVWMIWCGFPLLASLYSLFMAICGRQNPWLFRIKQVSIMLPNGQQRRQALMQMQGLWFLAGLATLVTFLAMLLFTDLAFGWSSTLLASSKPFYQLTQVLAAPFAAFWPSAVPTPQLVELSQFTRINPYTHQLRELAPWWQFLAASLITYNLLPRLLVWLGLWILVRKNSGAALTVGGISRTLAEPSEASLTQDTLSNWQAALQLSWELPAMAGVDINLGLGEWSADQLAINQLSSAVGRVLWKVSAKRAPVAELTDLIVLLRGRGITQQALLIVDQDQLIEERHRKSWQAFAKRQQLVWIKDAE